MFRRHLGFFGFIRGNGRQDQCDYRPLNRSDRLSYPVIRPEAEGRVAEQVTLRTGAVSLI